MPTSPDFSRSTFAMLEAARDAGANIVRPRFRNLDASNVRAKTNPFDLVTDADEEAEALLTERLRTAFPGALVTGEEQIGRHPEERALLETSPQAVLIDPIDGTLNYAHGVGVVATILVALAHGVPTAGVLYDPIANDAVVAERGKGAWFIHTGGWRRLLAPGADAPGVVLANSWKWPGPAGEAAMATLATLGPVRTLMSAAHDHRSLALGIGRVALFRDAEPWDHAAGVLVLEEMGGAAAFLDGAPYTVGRRAGPLVAVRDASALGAVSRALQGLLD